MLTEKATTVDLLRHGEPLDGRKFRGSTDDRLSEQGWQQMRAAVAEQTGWQQIVTSPLSRCAEFANELAAELSLNVMVEDELRELHFGDWEGVESELLWKEHAQQLIPFFKDPENNPPPGGELMADFRNRLMDCWNALLERYQGQNLLIVCHGGVIRVLLSQVLGLPMKHYARFDVPYACMSRICVYHTETGDFPLLKFHNPLPEGSHSAG